MLPKNFPHRKELRKKIADQNNNARKKMSLVEMLNLCATRPGESKREVERLIKKIEKENAKANMAKNVNEQKSKKAEKEVKSKDTSKATKNSKK